VAGAAVNNYDMTARAVLDTIPTSAIKQLVDLGNAGFASTDLLIVGEASANDTASLTSAYVQQTFYAAFSTADFTTLLATLVSAADMTAYASDPTTLGTLYMQALADKLVAAVKTNALDKGAPRIAILNTLDVTMTPKFQAMLTSIAQATNAATAMSVQAMVNGWIQAYNARLASDIAAYSSKIVIVDFYTNFTAEFTAPAQHGLTNTMATVCDEIVTGGAAPGATSLDTPSVVGACTDAAASAMGSPSNWWMSFLFADNFHPTPYGHQLLGQIVTNRLTEVGWL
jgi:phospholipase/lecithinase/hemolysin